MPPPVLVGWQFPAGVPKFWTAPRNDAAPPTDSCSDSVSVVVYDTPLPSLYATRIYYYNSWDEAQPPVVETNVSTIGRFTPTKLTRFAYNSWDQSQPPVVETNTHSIGRFTAANLTRFAYNSWDQSQPTVKETNTNFLAGFKPIKLTVWPSLYLSAASDSVTVSQSVGGGTYALPYVSRRLRISRSRRALGVFAAPLVIVEANPHFVASFKPVKPFVSSIYRQHADFQPPAVETNTHFIGRFTPAKLARFAYNSWDQSQPFVAETNVHTIGRFAPVKLTSFAYNSWDRSQPPAAETNTNFLAAFKPARLIVSPLLYQQQPALDFATAPQSVGGGTYALPYTSRRLRIFGRPRHVYVAAPTAPTFETNPHFLARFTPAKLTVSAFLRQHAEFLPRVAETNVHTIGRFAPVKLFVSPFLRQHAEFNPPVAETNPHYLAAFKPAKFLIWPFLRQHADFRPVATETNTNFVGTFKPVRLTVSPLLYQWKPALDLPPVPSALTGAGYGLQLQFPRHSWIVNTARYFISPVQPETNPHYLASFKPVKLTVWPFLNSRDRGGPEPPKALQGAGTYALPYTSRRLRSFGRPRHIIIPPPPVAATFETNQHFLARFAPARITVSAFLRQHADFNPAVVETNVHFVGRYRPANLLVSHLLYRQQPTRETLVTQPETNTNFLASFKPAKLYVWPFLGQHGDFGPPVTETNVHFLATFKNPPAWRFNFNSWDQSQPRAAETQPHYLARFTPTRFVIWSGFRQHADTQSVISETQPHYLAAFRPAKLISFAYNSTDTSTPQVETNVHFLAKFSPTNFIRFAYNSWDVQPPPAEANPHFLGSFRQVPTWRFNYNTRGDDPAVQETQPHFLGRFTPAKLLRFAFNSWESWDEAAPIVETNPHFIGFYRVPAIWRFGYNTRGDDPTVERSLPHFIARYVPARLSQFAFNSWDTGVPQVETNPHYLARFTPTKLNRFGYNTRSDDSAVAETNPHAIGSFRPTKITKLALLWNNSAADIYVAPTSSEPHFTGRFSQPKYSRFAFNTPDSLVPPSVDFWIVGPPRHLMATPDEERSLFAIGSQRHLMATTDEGRSLFATGSKRSLMATRED